MNFFCILDWPGDLHIYLRDPSGTEVRLTKDREGTYDDFDITFSMSGTEIPTNLNVGGAKYLPEQSFNAFNNKRTVITKPIFIIFNVIWTVDSLIFSFGKYLKIINVTTKGAR